MDDTWQKISKAIGKIRDLKEAISVIKKSGVLSKPVEKAEEKPAAPALKQPIPDLAEATALEDQEKPLKMLERHRTQSGHTKFIIGRAGDPTHYEMSVNLKDKRNKLPSISLSHMTSDGTIISRSNKLHDTHESAIKSVVAHNSSGKWDE